jgi:3-phosphoshikimate 1-carboxyvinyltransferase
MVEHISPEQSLSGNVVLPGDKSISHRYAMLASLAEGTSKIRNYSTGADCQSTLGCMRALGIAIDAGEEMAIHGKGLDGLSEPTAMLDAGNSGSTIRMLSGILAAQPFVSRIGGDESLSRRPMQRIMTPLAEMGARIEARDGKYPPLTINGGPLQPIHYSLPMASAQVKTCVLFAGLFAEGKTSVAEHVRTRDHSEVALREFGVEVGSSESHWFIGSIKHHLYRITVEGRAHLKPLDLYVPGDLSSAAFFLVAAQMVRESDVTILGVGLNPTRSSLLDFLASMGVNIKILDVQQTNGELIGSLRVRKSRVRGGRIDGALAAALIDEIPVLAVLGAMSEEGLSVHDASELRIKETDRIASIEENFRRMGVSIETRPDGFDVPGRQQFHAAELSSFGDHRIAMAFAVAALAADGPCSIQDAEAASVSFPDFFDTLQRIAA